jgi:hypothetical protein
MCVNNLMCALGLMFFTLCTNVTLAVGEVDMDASWESDEICGATIHTLIRGCL